MKPRDIIHSEILWQIIATAAWLHLATGVFTLSKWTGFLQVSWIAVFSPSLLYGALVLLIGASYTVARHRRRSSGHRVPVMAATGQRS
jgi:hypothetical protein